jgi:hypothetical protein
VTSHKLATLVIAAVLVALVVIVVVAFTHDVLAHRRRPPSASPPTVHPWVWNGEEFDRIWSDHQARKDAAD